jgi:hypothetical protein
MLKIKVSKISGFSIEYADKSLERLHETNYFWTLIYAGTVNQMSCTIWAVDFVAF